MWPQVILVALMVEERERQCFVRSFRCNSKNRCKEFEISKGYGIDQLQLDRYIAQNKRKSTNTNCILIPTGCVSCMTQNVFHIQSSSPPANVPISRTAAGSHLPCWLAKTKSLKSSFVKKKKGFNASVSFLNTSAKKHLLSVTQKKTVTAQRGKDGDQTELTPFYFISHLQRVSYTLSNG